MYTYNEEPFVKWKFDTLKLNWLDKITHERDSLIYNAFNYTSLNNNQLCIIEEIVRPKGTYEIILELQKLLENKKKQKALELDNLFGNEKDFNKLNNNQLCIIEEIVRPKGTYEIILELQKLLENKKKQKALELDNLFGNEKDFNKVDNHKEISPLTINNYTNLDVIFIFDLIRFT
ncbi:hypothetical protein Glove_564g42 [Diversispora epigaea]|uniref:Uncharacterized protein n=1 Tax=Diversispora epigaea TaxID=1348612 RepID=A0A397GAD2_9GLOM|nr:hypothetical protein Glove_564g42 [Diversispora epigaea]